MPTHPELDPFRLHAPESHAAFAAAAAVVDTTLPAELAARVAHRVAVGLGLPADVPGGPDGLTAIVDQFVVYSPGIDEAHRRRAAAELPGEVDLSTFLHAVYVADQTARQRLALGRLFPAAGEATVGSEPPSSAAGLPGDLPGAVREMHAAAMRLDRVDPVTTELLRLRAADYHRCRVCAAVRLVDAAAAGADEAFLEQRRDYESSDLSDAHKAALRLADAYMTHPAGIADALAGDVRARFTDAQVVEMLLDVSAFNLQKVYVALEIDAPPRDGDLALSFDARGHSVIV